MNSVFKPFQNATQSTEVDGLTVENSQTELAVYGNTNITRDIGGLARAEFLLGILTDAIKIMKADAHLPDHIQAAPTPQNSPVVKNPFA